MTLLNSNKLETVLRQTDPNIARVFIPYMLHHPKKIWGYWRLYRAFKTSKRIREQAKTKEITIPPFMMLSMTSKCNLNCIGCYATATHLTQKSGLNDEASKRCQLTLNQWRKLIKDAHDIGVFGYVLAGGEPFLLSNLLSLCEEFKNSMFLIFTNGTVLKEADLARLSHLSNVTVVVSLEGNERLTDQRRGAGVYKSAFQTLKNLNQRSIVTGVSVTISRANYEYWMSEASIDDLAELGVLFVFFLEYVSVSGQKPIECKSNDPIKLGEMPLTSEEQGKFREKVLEYRASKSVYIVHAPEDEEVFGGCQSSGKGFAHVTPEGDLTPCPVSGITTHNILTTSLQDALNSPLFQRLREDKHLLELGGGACALAAHPQEVENLFSRVKGPKVTEPLSRKILTGSE